jgi:hypothetical protein
MLMRTGNNSGGPGRWLVRIALSVLLAGPAFCWGSPHRVGGGLPGSRGGFVAFQSYARRGQAKQDSRANRGQRERARPAANSKNGPDTQRHPQPGRPGVSSSFRRGQEHLPAWWQAHRGLSSQQQVDALRRQPGFQNLPRGQQQRLIQRLHEFDQRPPMEQRRMLDRMEMFERLSPERQQEVRGASQALSRMPPARQRMMRHAFHELRGMPPEERQQILHSGYGAQFTPQERTVLGNLLSIEPYQGQDQIVQPYFGRR